MPPLLFSPARPKLACHGVSAEFFCANPMTRFGWLEYLMSGTDCFDDFNGTFDAVFDRLNP
jgi:hypothetical protein